MAEVILAVVMKITLALAAQSEATLLFAGDAMMHQAQIDAAHALGRDSVAYDYSDCFGPVKQMIDSADFAVVNLETPLGRRGFTGYPCFNAPASFAQALKQAGFDLFLTANNHCLDRRDSGLLTTISMLDSLGIEHIGTYANHAQRAERLPLVKDIKGFKVGFINCTYGTNGIELQSDAIVDYIDRQQLTADIAAARAAGAELVAMAVHWGNEYTLLPVSSQKALADFLVDQGVELIIGGHPHVVQPFEMQTDSTGTNYAVVWSLGNFISNMKTRDTRGGALAQVILRRDSLGHAYVAQCNRRLVFTVPPQGNLSHNFEVYPIDSVPSAWQPACEAFRRGLK